MDFFLKFLKILKTLFPLLIYLVFIGCTNYFRSRTRRWMTWSAKCFQTKKISAYGSSELFSPSWIRSALENNSRLWFQVLYLSTEHIFVAIRREDLKAFFSPMHELSRFIVEELTEALGLERDTFTRLETPGSNCTGRMNHYPVCPNPDSVLGIPPHADTQLLGILHQDDTGGLQVLKDGEWVGIQPDDSTFVVNIGDTFQVIPSRLHVFCVFSSALVSVVPDAVVFGMFLQLN